MSEQHANIRWVRVVNADAQPVPPFGVVAISGVDGTGAIAVARPTADGQRGVLFNGPVAIPPGLQGECHMTYPAIAAFDQTASGDAPVAGKSLGPAANKWGLRSGKRGFLAVGAAYGGRVNVVPYIPPPIVWAASVMPADYVLTDTLADTGCTLTIPEAGVYLLLINFGWEVSVISGVPPGTNFFRLLGSVSDLTNGLGVTSNMTPVILPITLLPTGGMTCTSQFVHMYGPNFPATLSLRACRGADSGDTVSLVAIAGPRDPAYTSMQAVKVCDIGDDHGNSSGVVSGSGGGGGNACCPGVTIPSTLHATFSGAGSCSGSYALSGGSGNWSGGASVGSCVGVTLSMQCAGGTMTFQIDGVIVVNCPLVSFDCVALTWTFQIPGPAGSSTVCNCLCGGTITVTV